MFGGGWQFPYSFRKAYSSCFCYSNWRNTSLVLNLSNCAARCPSCLPLWWIAPCPTSCTSGNQKIDFLSYIWPLEKPRAELDVINEFVQSSCRWFFWKSVGSAGKEYQTDDRGTELFICKESYFSRSTTYFSRHAKVCFRSVCPMSLSCFKRIAQLELCSLNYQPKYYITNMYTIFHCYPVLFC